MNFCCFTLSESSTASDKPIYLAMKVDVSTYIHILILSVDTQVHGKCVSFWHWLKCLAYFYIKVGLFTQRLQFFWQNPTNVSFFPQSLLYNRLSNVTFSLSFFALKSIPPCSLTTVINKWCYLIRRVVRCQISCWSCNAFP